MLSQGHVGATLYRYPGQVGPRFGKSGSLEENENDAIMSYLRLISTSVCFKHPYQTYAKCLRHWYAVSREYGCTLIQLHRPSWHQIWGFQVHLRSGNDAIKSCLGLISTSNHFIHPYQTYTKCFICYYAVSRACGCILISLHRPSWPQILGFRLTCGVKMMTLRHGSG